MPYNNEQLQAFFLYCQAVETAYQAVETAYHEWKNYWVNYFLNNKQEDLYDPFDPNVLNKWLTNQLNVSWRLPKQS